LTPDGEIEPSVSQDKENEGDSLTEEQGETIGDPENP